jgi:hypothetical protein
MASYVLVGELALGEVLAGALPRPEFPDALRQVAPARWRRRAASSLAERHDVVACAGLLAKAAQAALAGRGEWALNDQGIVRRAGLGARVELRRSQTGTPTPGDPGRGRAARESALFSGLYEERDPMDGVGVGRSRSVTRLAGAAARVRRPRRRARACASPP